MSERKLSPLAEQLQEWTTEVQNDVPRLPEHFFVNHLLPVLTDTSGKADLSVWLDVAGSGLRPIDIIDIGTQQVLFRVPALFTTVPTRISRGFEGSLSQLGEETRLRMDQHPAIGQTFLNHHLSQVKVGEGAVQEKAIQWSRILKRYGYEPLVPIPDDPSTPDPAVPTHSERPALSDQQDDF